MSWFFFESLPALAAVLFTIDFVLLVIWRRSGRAKPLLVGLGLSITLLAMQGLVVTQREHAARLLKVIERDILAAQTVNLAAALSDDFRAGRMDKEQFLALVGRQYNRVQVKDIYRSQLEVRQSQADRFVVEAAYQADVRTEQLGGWMPSRWELTFSRTAEGWRISAIRPLHLVGFSNPDWDVLDRP
jgi:hypothetical protein